VTSATLPVLLAVWLQSPLGAQGSVSASVDRDRVGLDETVSLRVTADGTEDVTPPEIPDLDGLVVVSTGQSTSVNIGGGGATYRTVFEYLLRPTRTGTFTIPALSLRAGNRVLKTEPVTVQVTSVRGGSGAPVLPAPAVPPLGPGSRASADDTFVRCTVDRKQAYVGEQIVLTFGLYYAAPLGSVEYEPPGVEGFRTQALPSPPARYETVNGKQYAVKEDLRLLFPTAPGRHTITPATVQYTTGFWDPTPRTLTTEPLVVEVQRLPEAGKPNDFCGVVGELTVRVSLDRGAIRMGEAATLTARVSGWGNLDAMDAPRLALPPGLRQYQSSEHREAAPKPLGDSYRMEGQALFDHVIIPTTAGEVTIPPVHVSYFDPTAGRYATARGGLLVLRVLPGAGGPLPDAQAAMQGAQLRPLPDRLTSYVPGRLLTTPLVVSQLLALAWLAVALALYRQRVMLAANPCLARARGAKRRALALLREARRLPPKEAADHLATAIATYFGDKLGVPSATVSPVTVGPLLRQRGVDSEACERLVALLQEWDRARFSPSASATPSAAMAQAAASALADLDRVLPAAPPEEEAPR
jgi:hypothetical protein